jgi:uncharacterized membrane protein YhaH (DUF805 family)
MTLMDAVNSAFKNYANFDGRARRSEYWYFALFNLLVSLCLVFISPFLYLFYLLAIIIPSIAVLVRRLHDIGKSGWMYFVGLIPLVGGIWLLVLLCTDSQVGDNEYGANPKTGILESEIDNIGSMIK